ncbi:Hypothetical protein FKW44_024161 [Caligus rogercresseyi]|uniref:Uncharacterized protein n=1 Tax=Caligus rogercresseyi TaxID=217165 RepID=A0A7T8GLE6_CALRO|nr:Hypothetical protein FKW44_024666 [Caligus rogercresseyi]QQP32960.1 Hypothetical protein FKW44_024161 [Caligus rogercresseyi]
MGSLLPGFENLGLQHNNGMNSSYGSSSASRHGGGSSSTSLHAAAAAAAAAAAHYGQHFHTPPHHHPQHWGQSTPLLASPEPGPISMLPWEEGVHHHLGTWWEQEELEEIMTDKRRIK